MSHTFPSFPILDDKQRFIVYDPESGAVALYEVRGLSVVNVTQAVHDDKQARLASAFKAGKR